MTTQTFWHRNSIALFTLLFSLMISVGLVSSGFFSGVNAVSLFGSTTDSPENEGGDGYQSSDDCGYLMKKSTVYYNITVDVGVHDDDEQACLDAFSGVGTGFFNSGSGRESYVSLTGPYGTIVVDLAPNDVELALLPKVNLETGKWSGYGKIISSTNAMSFDGMEWVWFDWVCTDTSACDPAMIGNEEAYHVKSNLSTNGDTYNFAWSDYIAALRGPTSSAAGFIKFNGTDMETPPMVIVPYVEIEASGSGVTPSAANRDNAPQANGVDYWRVGIYFVDMVTGQTLDESDINALNITVNTTDSVFTNQVRNEYDAVDTSTWHYKDCTSGTGNYCVMTIDGTVTFNKFIRSYGPTSNVVYMDETVATVEQELPTDRDGCIWTYMDQLNSSSGPTPRKCYSDTLFSKYGFNYIDPDVKWDYFYARSDERNYIYLDDISFYIDLETSQDYRIRTDDNFQEADGQGGDSSGYYTYTPGDSETELTFSPRFYLDGLYAEYDGASNWTTISSVLTQSDMYLLTEGAAYAPSLELSDYLGASIDDRFAVKYQLDAGTDFERDSAPEDVFLVMDVVDRNIVNAENNVTFYSEVISIGATGYSTSYPIGYSYTDEGGCFDLAAGTVCMDIDWNSETADYIENPTAEIWVCDKAVEQVLERRRGSGQSCYFVGYLPVVDNHADPGGVLFMGTTGEFLGLSLDESDDIYEGGAEETIKVRNNFYELGTRYTLGVTAGAGTLDLNSTNPVSTGNGVRLMGGNLYYYNGDVVVSEATSFNDATLYVVGGDVYIEGDLGSEDSRLGIIALAQNGVGGNVYVSNTALDTYMNIFADGSVLSYSSTYDSEGFPTWLNDAYRMAALKNQLYINGSITARMILNQDDVYSVLGKYTCGGAELSYEQAYECSLENLRQFRLCYELDSTGSPTTTLELCEADESELSVYGTAYAGGSLDAEDYPSVIIDYTAPGNLPIFASDGIFN